MKYILAILIQVASAVTLKQKDVCEPGWCPGTWNPSQPPVWTEGRFNNMNERSWVEDEPKTYRSDYGPAAAPKDAPLLAKAVMQKAWEGKDSAAFQASLAASK